MAQAGTQPQTRVLSRPAHFLLPPAFDTLSWQDCDPELDFSSDQPASGSCAGPTEAAAAALAMAATLPAGLHSLPSELIWDIHLLALTPALAITSTQLFLQLARPPSALAARFLLSYHTSAPPIDLLSRILRHGVCTLDVFQTVERLFSDRQVRGVVPSSASLQVKELPKRLFRNLLEPNVSPPQLKSTLLPFLAYLFDKYQPCPSSHKGYPLCAALTEHPTSFPLVRYLLDKGADPSMKDGYAVLLAIDKGDLELIRLLVEGGWERGGGSSLLAGASTREERGGFDEGGRVGTKRKRVESDSPKRRRKADRVKITSKMLSVSLKRKNKDITNYLLSKGAVPDLKTLSELGRR